MTVTVYGKPGCMQCRSTERHFDKLGVEYTKVDVMSDQDGMSVVTGLGYQQLPVVVAGQTHWSGYRPDQIRECASVAVG